jgi:predicted nucleic acid-binding protein
MWVFDATPLIYLAKADALSYIDDIETDPVIPARVEAEVVDTGIQQGYPDARRIEAAIDAGVLRVKPVAETAVFSRLQRNPKLSAADAAVLAQAAAADGTAVMDETHGRTVATTEGITTRGTAYVVLLLAKRGVISVATAETIIDELVDSGWYCAPDTYAKLRQQLEAFGD